jgi:hypothetical protein
VTAGAADLHKTASFTPVHYNDGDILKLRHEVSGAVVNALVRASIDIVPDVPGDVVLFSPGNGNIDGSSVLWASVQGNSDNADQIEGEVVNVAPVDFWVKKFRGDLTVAPGTGKNRTITLRKDGVDQPPEVVLSNAELSEEWEGSLLVEQGSLLAWRETPTGGPATSFIGTSTLITCVQPVVPAKYIGARATADVYVGAGADPEDIYVGVDRLFPL